MPLRKRVSLAAAGAVAAAVAIAVMVCYFVVRDQLLSQIDGQLRAQARSIQNDPNRSLNEPLPGLSASAGGSAPYLQVVLADGAVVFRQGNTTLPGTSHAAAVATGSAHASMSDVQVGGASVREYSFPLPGFVVSGQQIAVQLGRPLAYAQHVLSSLRLILLLLFLGGVALAAGLGRMAARRVLSPLSEVTLTAEVIGETDDLSLRLAVHADDEVGQLATRFNAMLERLATSRAALDDSVRSQRQLVADASHELRTPVTSLRTNIEVLLAGGELGEDERRRLLDDVVEQSEELSRLVNDLIEVSRGDLPPDSVEDIRLDHVVEEAVVRAQRNAQDTEFVTALEPIVVRGSAERLGRAVNNLVDNAARHNDPGRPVEVSVDAHGVRVRDHGGGIDPQDLPYIFDRFYRGANSRASQGSGLGLAIVRQVAESHGGSALAANAPDGGAVFTLRLPGKPAEATDSEAAGGVYGAGGLASRA
ncbi:MAG TPA: HAMP domain-containing sensor histidine kinase [Solirubrobacteraceae bacterium]|jgi:two-component system sensor histidine kinase MprB|nr:HAMP domain-containing sensor histidine kinase [Solirubrobacteraceae bacterium]